MHFSSSSGLSALSPSGRESVDPIAELLSQLSGVRRGGPQTSQLQQLQMQIQLERQQVTVCNFEFLMFIHMYFRSVFIWTWLLMYIHAAVENCAVVQSSQGSTPCTSIRMNDEIICLCF